MPIFAWIIGVVAIFALITIFMIFVPVINNNIGDAFINATASNPGSSKAVTTLNLVKAAVPIALVILIIGVLIYMALATQVEEPHTDII